VNSNCTRCRLESGAGQPAQQAILRVCRLEIAMMAMGERAERFEAAGGKAQAARQAIPRAVRCGEPAVVRLAAKVLVPRRMVVSWAP
jgi:hypothetical protein